MATYVYRDGKVVPKEQAGPRPATPYLGTEAAGCRATDTRIRCFQLPRWYKHASRWDDKGTVIATSHKEASELAKRAQGSGEPLHYDR